MDEYQWDLSGNRIPLPHENFDFCPDYNDLDAIINHTLTGLQDLDVPSGYADQSQSKSFKPGHGRKSSGTAIFGFVDHNKDFSISGLNDLYKPIGDSPSIAPNDLKLSNVSPGALDLKLNSVPHPDELDLTLHGSGKPVLLLENDEIEEEQQQFAGEKPQEDLIVTNNNPKSYKFPPQPSSPIPQKSFPSLPPTSASSPIKKDFQSVNTYSVKYLQLLNNQQFKNYVDDIEPLLDDDLPDNSQFNGNSYKFVPIPVQQPKVIKKQPPPPPSHSSPSKNVFQKNPFLAPPQPPTLSQGSPDWQSSPEPQSPSPSNNLHTYQDSSPVHPQLKNANFYDPQFFSDPDDFGLEPYSDDLLYQQQNPANGNLQAYYNRPLVNHKSQPNLQQQLGDPHQSNQPPQQQYQQIMNLNNMANQLQSSPIHASPNSPDKYFSPVRNTQQTNDDTVDANATITQLTPLKNNFPNTPSRNQVQLEWSPIISPNSKGSKDVKLHIQQSTPKRIKKTSLLPPGELDQYWEGPDEDKTYTCTYQNCRKKFTRRYNVRSHIQTHLSDRPFACSYCPKKFVRQHDLNRHVKGHLEARQCKCPCGKEFARLDALKKHKERNICIGGTASTTNNSVVKPLSKSKPKNDILDEFTSNKLAGDIASTVTDGRTSS